MFSTNLILSSVYKRRSLFLFSLSFFLFSLDFPSSTKEEITITPFSLAIPLVKIHTRLISDFLVSYLKSKLPLVKILGKLRLELSSRQLEQSVVDLYWPYSSIKDWVNLTNLMEIA